MCTHRYTGINFNIEHNLRWSVISALAALETLVPGSLPHPHVLTSLRSEAENTSLAACGGR